VGGVVQPVVCVAGVDLRHVPGVFMEKGRADLGVAGWMVMTFVMAAVSVMLFLMGCRKLPACVIEEGE
jgi:hypothetical protein